MAQCTICPLFFYFCRNAKFSLCVLSPFPILQKHIHTHAPFWICYLFPISKSFPYLHPFEWNGFPLCCKMSKLGDDGLADFKMPLRFIGLIFIGDHSGKKETDGGHLWAWAFMRSLARLCLSGLGVSKGVVKWGFRRSVRNEDLVFACHCFCVSS